MEPIVGDEVLSHRHILSSKSLQPLLALVSYETDEEQWNKYEKRMDILYRGRGANSRFNVSYDVARTLNLQGMHG